MVFTNHETRNTDFVAVVFAVDAQGTHNQKPLPGPSCRPPGRCFPARCGAAWGGMGGKLPPEPVSARRQPPPPSPSGLLPLSRKQHEPMMRKRNVLYCPDSSFCLVQAIRPAMHAWLLTRTVFPWPTMASVSVTALVLLLSVLPAAAAPAGVALRKVSFDTSDGGKIHANLYGGGSHGVVLAHGAVFDKESWHEQATCLARAGLRVLAIDFRGYGDSRPGSLGRALYLDILGAVKYLDEAGCESVSIVGGSMGGGAAAQAAVEAEPGAIDRLVLLAHSPIDDSAAMQGDKLFIATEGDHLAARRRQFDQASEPKKWVVLDGSSHAQHIFKTPQAEELMDHILDWLTNQH